MSEDNGTTDVSWHNYVFDGLNWYVFDGLNWYGLVDPDGGKADGSEPVTLFENFDMDSFLVTMNRVAQRHASGEFRGCLFRGAYSKRGNTGVLLCGFPSGIVDQWTFSVNRTIPNSLMVDRLLVNALGHFHCNDKTRTREMHAIAWLCPQVAVTLVRCPVGGCDRHPSPDRETIGQMIVHLNDDLHWTREAIADWLDTLDVDLTVKRVRVHNAGTDEAALYEEE